MDRVSNVPDSTVKEAVGHTESEQPQSLGPASFDPLLLGLGLFLAWSLCLPWVRGHLIVYSGPANVSVAVHGLALIGTAVLCNVRRTNLLSAPLLVACGALATLSPALSLAAAQAVGSVSTVLGWAASLCEGLALALMYLLWNEQYARRPVRASWPCYAASFGSAPLAYFVLTSVPLPVAAGVVLLMPAASCLLLWRSARRADASEPVAEPVGRSWRFPWRPALIMTVFSFAHYMLMHLFGGASSMGQLGSLVIAGAVLVGCTTFFDRFDPRFLYKLCPPLMVYGLLSLSLGSSGLAEAGLALGYAGFTGFSLFMAFILSSICFRYGVHAAWLFGIVEGCSVLAHAGGSYAGSALLAWSGTQADSLVALALPLDAVVVVLVLLSMLLLSERDFSTTWGIRPSTPPQDERATQASNTDLVIATGQAGAGETPGWELEDRVARIARHFGLTHREEQILGLVAQGKNAQDIETALFISHNTAKGHIRHVYAKLGVHAREEAEQLVHTWR